MKTIAKIAHLAGSFACGIGLAALAFASPFAKADENAPCTPALTATQAADASSGTPPQETSTPVPTSPGPDPSPSSPPQTAPSLSSTPPIALSELLPDPVGDDAQEFIELANLGTDDVDLAGWKIADAKGHAFTVGDVRVGGGAFIHFLYPESKIRLPNTGGSLTLSSPDGSARDAVSYSAPVPEGKSYARIDGGWRWTARPTPGEANIGDIHEPPPEPAPEAGTTTSTLGIPLGQADFTNAPNFSALLPNPAGADQDEWIELRNATVANIALAGWRVADAGGVYAFSGSTLPAGGTLRISRSTSAISLNNDTEDLRLLDPRGEVRDEVTYVKAPSGAEYVRDGSAWRWDPPPTATTMPDASTPAGAAATTVDPITAAAAAPTRTDTAPATATIEQLDSLEQGADVTVTGTVTLPPGVAGKSVLAVQDDAGENGVFIRMRGRGVPPSVTQGDEIVIRGKVASGDYALSASPGDIRLLAKRTSLPHAQVLGPVDIDQADMGLAVILKGTVAGRGKRWITVTDDAAEQEIRAVFARGTAPPAKQGDAVSVKGVVRMAGGRPVLVVTDPTSAKVTPRIDPAAVATPQTVAPAPDTAPQARPTLVLDARASRPAAGWIALAATAVAGAVAYVLWKRRRFA